MRALLFALALAVTQVPAAAMAQQSGGVTGEEILVGVISEIERRIIGRYYHGDRYEVRDTETDKKKKAKGNKGKGKSKGLPPGLAKRDQLPPGLAKQLDEHGRLPPGLANRDLPDDLQRSLPQRPNEHFVVIDNDIVLIERTTGLVLDVLEGILRGSAIN